MLMKLLWVTRLCRPDLAYSICLLAGQVTKWSHNCDKQLLRLISYLNSTKNLCLHLSMLDSPQDCTIDLFCDAGLGGCPHTAKSTSGLFLVVRGPQGTFIPRTWNAHRQTHVAAAQRTLSSTPWRRDCMRSCYLQCNCLRGFLVLMRPPRFAKTMRQS